VQPQVVYVCDCTLTGRQLWYPQQVPGSPSGTGNHTADFI